MTRMRKLLFSVSLSIALGGLAAWGQIPAASCSASDVQTAINKATEGQTVTIPAGTCTWTSGVNISGKGITVQGAGSGRIIAQSVTTLTVGTGSRTFTITSSRVDGTFPLGPTVGQTLRAFQTGARSNWMQGTVTSFDTGSGVLVMNITSTGGNGSVPLWCIGTIPSTVIANNSTGSALFDVTEDTSLNTDISGIKFLQGTTTSFTAFDVKLSAATGGQAVLIHDCWMEAGGAGSSIYAYTNRGVVWNCSFDSTPFAQGGTVNSAISVVPMTSAATSWTTPSTWGAADKTGQGNFYFETNDVHAYLIAGGTDDGGRMVWRYNLMDNAGWGNHGADSSNYGARYLEYYQNVGLFDTRPGVTFNLAVGWVFVRGGTFVAFNNTLPNINSQDTGQKSNIMLSVFNLQQNAGPNPCWGAGTSGGAHYHAPRQTGYGYVTGAGMSPNGSGETHDAYTYVGDSEPIYIWNNSITPMSHVNIVDFGGNQCTNPDTSANYIVLNRDYFNGTTAKPGYTPYTYPHPFRMELKTSVR